MYGKTERHSFKVFSDDLRSGRIKNCLLMYGEEQYLIKWAVETLVKKFVNPASESMDFIILDEDPSCSEIIEACETFSMFSARKIVWVRDFRPLSGENVKGCTKDDLKLLTDYIAEPNEGTTVVFSSEEIKASASLTSALKKHGASYDFKKINRNELISFAGKRFRAAGVEIPPREVRLLIDATGYFNKESDYTLFSFANDIQKVIAHSDGVKITEKDISETVSGDEETFVFEMLDGISGSQKEKAFRILYNILHTDSGPYPVIGAIVSQFELMLSVRQLLDDGKDFKEICRKLGGSEFRIKKMIPYANRFSEEKLKSILSGIYEVDRKIKNGLLDPQTALELFIAGI